MFPRIRREGRNELEDEIVQLLRRMVRSIDLHSRALSREFELTWPEGYKLNGLEIDFFPAGMADQAAVDPIFETLPGWSASTEGARSWADLPAEAVKYVKRVEELIGAPVALLSTSPERDDMILMRDPFED